MRWLIDIGYILAGLLYIPIALYNALVLGKNRSGWRERFGAVPSFEPGRQRIWIHAVSLGEINCTPKLVEMLQTQLPDCDIVISTTTDTGYARAIQHFGQQRVFRFPLDFSFVMSRVLRRIKPTLLVLVELELWPNLVGLANRRGIPIVVVNGRLTERSARRLGYLGSLTRRMFARLTWVGAQDATIATRFRQLGVQADRVEVTSSIKWDSALVADDVTGTQELAEALGISKQAPLWVCGSTGPGEEAILLTVYRRLLDDWSKTANDVSDASSSEPSNVPVLVIVPRKPERFNEVARLIKENGFDCRRRSVCQNGTTPSAVDPRQTVVLGDTMGELRKYYALSDLVFVGRSLVPMGGSDPMEVAALGKPMVAGPYMSNFHLPVTVLSRAGAMRTIGDANELATIVLEMLSDTAAARILGLKGREVVSQQQGATQLTADKLVSLINKRS